MLSSDDVHGIEQIVGKRSSQFMIVDPKAYIIISCHLVPGCEEASIFNVQITDYKVLIMNDLPVEALQGFTLSSTYQLCLSARKSQAYSVLV